MDFSVFGIKTSYEPTGKVMPPIKSKPRKSQGESFEKNPPVETLKRGKLTLKLVKDSGTGKPIPRTIYQIARFAMHVEAQGYVTSYNNKKPVGKNSNGEKVYYLYISTRIVPAADRKLEMSKMKAKMKGVPALNTSTQLNPGCQKAFRGDGGCDPTICKSCYSMKGLVEGKTGNPAKATSMAMLARNTRLLTRGPLANIPKVTTQFFRFSAEGDLQNAQHLLNYYAIAKANPNTHFTIWTKRHNIVVPILQKYGKPRNLFIIQSSMRLNKPDVQLLSGYSKMFTVYTPAFLKEHPEIKINCGAKSCMGCQLCYTSNNVTVINERLKGKGFKVGKSP